MLEGMSIFKGKFFIILHMKKPNTLNPAVCYTNADIQKVQILSENSKKSGIYLWIKKEKKYVGSAKDLRKRLYCYFNIKYLERNQSMYINRALLKYGYSNFSLMILEYCDPKDLLKREKYYMGSLEPEYNISKEPSAFFTGLNHSEETKGKISEANLGRAHSEEAKSMISAERRNRISQPVPGIRVDITDLETNVTTTYDSIRSAAASIGSYIKTILRREKSQLAKGVNTPYRGRYLINIKRSN